MDINDLHPADDYSHRFFIWHEWILANGPLTAENVFDYFATSMFYDKQSNNQVLRMQTMHTGVPIKDEAAELRRFIGIEFAVVHAQPPVFFIIQKRERLSPDETRPLAVYFIMNSRIYQSPDLYTVVSNRLLTSVSALQSSLDILRKHRPEYTPRTGFIWPISDPSLVIDGDSSKTRESEAQNQSQNYGSDHPRLPEERGSSSDGLPPEKRGSETNPRRQKNTMLLMNAMKTTAAHSKMSFTQTGSLQSQQSINESIDHQADGGTPVTGTMRSSATPGPSGPQIAGSQQESSQEGAKGPSTGVKKKRKRASLAPPPAPS